jgi:hypothetical protein
MKDFNNQIRIFCLFSGDCEINFFLSFFSFCLPGGGGLRGQGSNCLRAVPGGGGRGGRGGGGEGGGEEGGGGEPEKKKRLGLSVVSNKHY